MKKIKQTFLTSITKRMMDDISFYNSLYPKDPIFIEDIIEKEKILHVNDWPQLILEKYGNYINSNGIMYLKSGFDFDRFILDCKNEKIRISTGAGFVRMIGHII